MKHTFIFNWRKIFYYMFTNKKIIYTSACFCLFVCLFSQRHAVLVCGTLEQEVCCDLRCRWCYRTPKGGLQDHSTTKEIPPALINLFRCLSLMLKPCLKPTTNLTSSYVRPVQKYNSIESHGKCVSSISAYFASRKHTALKNKRYFLSFLFLKQYLAEFCEIFLFLLERSGAPYFESLKSANLNSSQQGKVTMKWSQYFRWVSDFATIQFLAVMWWIISNISAGLSLMCHLSSAGFQKFMLVWHHKRWEGCHVNIPAKTN